MTHVRGVARRYQSLLIKGHMMAVARARLVPTEPRHHLSRALSQRLLRLTNKAKPYLQ